MTKEKNFGTRKYPMIHIRPILQNKNSAKCSQNLGSVPALQKECKWHWFATEQNVRFGFSVNSFGKQQSTTTGIDYILKSWEVMKYKKKKE